MADEPQAPEAPTEPPPTEPSLEDQLLDGQPEGDLTVSDQPPPDTPADDTPPTPEGGEPAGDEPPPEPEFNFLDSMREAGFQDIENETDAQQRMLQAYGELQQQFQQQQQQAAQMQPYAQQFFQLQQDPAYQQFLAQQQGAAQPQQPPADAKWWDPPPLDQAFIDKYYVVDPTTGERGWKPDTPMEGRNQAEAHQSYLNNWQTELLTQPDKAFARLQGAQQQAVRDTIAGIFGIPSDQLDNLKQRIDLDGSQNFARGIIEQNRELIYARDPVSNEIDYSRLTPEGEYIFAGVRHAAEIGIQDVREQWNHAISGYELAVLRNQVGNQTQQQQIQQTNAQKKQAVVDQNRNLPNRGGSLPRPEEPNPRPQNEHVSPGEQFADLLEQSGHPLSI